MCTISPFFEQVSDTGKSRTSPASTHFTQVRLYEKEQALFVSKQQRIVCQSTQTATSHERDVPTIFCLRIFNLLAQVYHHSGRLRV